MARSQLRFSSPPDAVFAALSDGESYDRWVVGAKDIRTVDPAFPRPGAALHHTVGAGPLEVRDSTEVEAATPGRFLRLEARVRPLGVARVQFRLEPDGDGTLVVMEEWVTDPPLLRLLNPLLDPLVRIRNDKTLARLRDRIEGTGERRATIA